MIKCPKCQNEINDNEKFCPKCGYKLLYEQNGTITDTGITQIINNKKFIVSVIATVIILMFIIVALICSYSSKISNLEANYTELKKSYSDLEKVYTDYKNKVQATPKPTSTPIPTSVPTTPPQQKTKQSSNTKSNKNEVLCGVPCVFSDYQVTYNNFSISSDYQGNAVIIENFTFENFASEAREFMTTASVTMYQDGVELENAYFVDGYDVGLSQRKIQQGGKFDVQEAHILRNKTSPVTIEINDWISFNGIKYKGIIPLS